MRYRHLAAACGLAVFAPLHAGEIPLLDEIVVTASRLPQPLVHTLMHTTVLTEGAIRASLAPDLPTLLRQQAGIEITQSGGLGTQSSLFLRGTESDHTLVLLDGQRIGSATTGTTALDQVMLADIERIEIVRGNVSALYGSEAIGGVIQIFTKRGSGKPGGEIKAGLGSYGERRLAASYGGAFGATRVHLGLSRLTRDGFSAIRPEFVSSPPDLDDDGYRNTTFTLNLEHALGPAHTLGLSGRASRGRVEYDGTWTNRSEQDLENLQLTSRHGLWPGASGRLLLGVSRDAYHAYLDAMSQSHFTTRNRQASWQLTQTLAPGHDLNLDLSWLGQRVSNNMTYTRTRREVASASLAYAGRSGGHAVQLAARHDDYSDFGDHNTWLAAYGYDLTPSWRLMASAGTAFRAPSFNDLYNQWVGNPNLKPERSRSHELGVQYADKAMRARLVRFDTRTRDLIVWQGGGLDNVGRARSDGWELTLDSRLAGLDMGLSLTLQDPRNEATGARLIRRARRLGSLHVGQSRERWGWRAEVKASGQREDFHVTSFTPTTVKGYAVANLSGHYQLAKDLRLEGRLDNLFDRDYSLVHGYQTPGRSGYLGVAWQF